MAGARRAMRFTAGRPFPKRGQVKVAILRSIEMAGARRAMRFTAGRPIPKRGQVKVAILVGLAHSVASIFSQSSRRAASHFS
ncbi:hypothetical protein ACOSP7_012128 [Xanthoceras sorbifolium]|uniref:Uncharacterized protein n=1 Tax=Xanthoceras sorbifolium TaxID=99658 RepID=A0ABQ8HX90_9ROSI|nr:hypothetical protein JRO89_XS06G0083400 [Xanthoceras sorbifolium]